MQAGPERALRELVPGDRLTRALARTKIAEALFAKREAVAVGRYHLLEMLGAGGMGTVWGAWDPDLARRVAIKVVKPELSSSRERIVREGQALAKLSHPHVVPVFDVGVIEDAVYLVMEWVRGQTLRAWTAEPRALRDIVRAYREAAMGLVAAHEVGLVHRDFKPENAMLGSDGRVRVLDFGLARADGAAGRGGTPRYMAPEQAAGREVTPAVDQYAFGIALREALGDAPPKWLAAIATRATAAACADRFPSMQAIVDELGRDPRRTLRRRIALAGALGFASIAFAVGTRAGSESEESCVGGRAEVATAWSPAARVGVVAHLLQLGPYGHQLAERATGELDAYATQWTVAHAAACHAHDRGELTTPLYSATVACLARARVALGAARDVLAATPRERLSESVVAVESLPDPDRCRLETRPPPAAIAPQVTAVANDVARARVLATATDPHAIEMAASAARAAEALGDPQLVGRASLAHGLALLWQQDRPAAAQAFARATAAAFEAGDGATAIEALARHVYTIASADRPLDTTERVLGSLDVALPIAKGLATTDAFTLALFYNNLGTLRLSRQDRKGARAYFELADRVRPGMSRETFELASIAGNLGLVEPDPARRDELLRREGDELAAALGPDHPLALDARLKAAMFVADGARSLELLAAACGRYRRVHPHLAEKIAQCAYETGWLAEERGDVVAAAEWFAALADPLSPDGTIGRGYRDLQAGRAPREVAVTMAATADRLAAAPQFWSRWRAVDASILAALAARRSGDRTFAIERSERALAMIDGFGEFAATPFVQRRHRRLVAMLAALTAASR